jgi:hypothetical protein
MSEITIIIQSRDKTKRTEVSVEDSINIQDLLNGAIKYWDFPAENTTYAIHNESQEGSLMSFKGSLASEGVRNGDNLTVSWQAG